MKNSESRVENPPLFVPSIERVELLLQELLPAAETAPQPLHRAMRHAVFSGGKRLRPRLLLAVAAAACHPLSLRPNTEALILRSACAVELIHAASLVHDDLPCFDDASERRGLPTVQHLYGEPLAILAGDALLSLAFEALAGVPPQLAGRAMAILRRLAAATGSREGVIGGQSIEQGGTSFPPSLGDDAAKHPELVDRYHAMKSAALFQFATEVGALAVGDSHTADWAEVGRCLGLAYQLIDDLTDCFGESPAAGKPVRRDAELGRPNAALLRGQAQTCAQVRALCNRARRLTRSRTRHPTLLFALFDQLNAHMELALGKLAKAPANEKFSSSLASSPQGQEMFE